MQLLDKDYQQYNSGVFSEYDDPPLHIVASRNR